MLVLGLETHQTSKLVPLCCVLAQSRLYWQPWGGTLVSINLLRNKQKDPSFSSISGCNLLLQTDAGTKEREKENSYGVKMKTLGRSSAGEGKETIYLQISC